MFIVSDNEMKSIQITIQLANDREKKDRNEIVRFCQLDEIA